MLTEKDIDQIGEIVDQSLDEKLIPFRSEIMGAISDVMGELKAIRESFDILAPRSVDHEERIGKLETIHPGGQHAS